MKKAILIQLIALVILILGNASRPYPAFGGEDLAYITLSVVAIRELFVERRSKKKWN